MQYGDTQTLAFLSAVGIYEAVTGRLTKRTDAQANLRWERTYEAATGRLDTQLIKNNSTGATLASFDLGYDPAGNVASKASSVFSNPANGSWSYTYDGASRLTRAIGPNATGASTTYDYAYEGGGNRVLAKETTGQVVKNLSTTYDAAGLPTSAADAATGETVTYAHDQVGDLTGVTSSISGNTWTYAYDAYSRLTCAVQGSSCASGSTRSCSPSTPSTGRSPGRRGRPRRRSPTRASPRPSPRR